MRFYLIASAILGAVAAGDNIAGNPSSHCKDGKAYCYAIVQWFEHYHRDGHLVYFDEHNEQIGGLADAICVNHDNPWGISSFYLGQLRSGAPYACKLFHVRDCQGDSDYVLKPAGISPDSWEEFNLHKPDWNDLVQSFMCYLL